MYRRPTHEKSLFFTKYTKAYRAWCAFAKVLNLHVHASCPSSKMGNSCRKNVDEQVRQPNKLSPEDIQSEIRDLEELQILNKRLRQQKEALERELARWREEKVAQIKQIEDEIKDIKKEIDRISEPASSPRTPLRALSSSNDEKLLQLQEKQAILQAEIEKLTLEREKLEIIENRAAVDAKVLLQIVNDNEEVGSNSGSSDVTTASQIQDRKMAKMSEYYRPIGKMRNCGDVIKQARIDCAELSSQTTRNTKALAHSFKNGDLTWYQEKPIRGVLCSTMQCGEEPHDRWNCNLCALLDVTDAPLLL